MGDPSTQHDGHELLLFTCFQYSVTFKCLICGKIHIADYRLILFEWTNRGDNWPVFFCATCDEPSMVPIDVCKTKMN